MFRYIFSVFSSCLGIGCLGMKDNDDSMVCHSEVCISVVLPLSTQSPVLCPSATQSSVPRPSPPMLQEDGPPFPWKKGPLIGSGAFGKVYMGMNLDSGEFLAVKQVCLPARGASNAKTQAYITELEDEVELLKNLSHPNIVRYLGTARDAEALNILLEFVPGGSIHSLLEKFESFPESVIREYAKQLLLGLEYLHKNGIIHRDIKGANILVDNKACIKLADFGASKKVVDLATIGAKSMKGTVFWMAPEVIRQTGHSFSADIWSVGCTFIEMATGKPPWVDQHQDACMAAALHHIGSARTPPPIPENLSADAKDFLLKCFQMEPSSRASASDLLQHPFVRGKNRESQNKLSPAVPSSLDDLSKDQEVKTSGVLKELCYLDILDFHKSSKRGFTRDSNADNCDDMCKIDDDFVFVSGKWSSPVDNLNKASSSPSLSILSLSPLPPISLPLDPEFSEPLTNGRVGQCCQPAQGVLQRQRWPGLAMPQAQSQRVQQGCVAYCERFRRDGIRRVLHPYQEQRSPGQTMPKARSQRVQQGCVVRRDGIHRVLRETDRHLYQQQRSPGQAMPQARSQQQQSPGQAMPQARSQQQQSPGQALPQARLQRVQQGCVAHCKRFRRDGIRRRLCEADPHPNQQQRSPGQAMPQAQSQRVQQGCIANCERFNRDGIRRVLCKADLHPYQQHHRWIQLGLTDTFKGKGG